MKITLCDKIRAYLDETRTPRREVHHRWFGGHHTQLLTEA